MKVQRDDQVEATFLRFNIFSPDEFAAIFANELRKTLDEFSVKKRLEAQATLSSKTTLATSQPTADLGLVSTSKVVNLCTIL